jgi:hypothetical protein
LERQVEPAQGLLQRVAAEFDELRPRRLDLRQDVLLVVIADRRAGLAVRLDAFLERRVVKLAMQPHPGREPFGLAGIGVQLEGDFTAFHVVIEEPRPPSGR